MLSCGTVHLVTEALDVIQGVDYENRVLSHLSLHRGEQCASRGLLSSSICTSQLEMRWDYGSVCSDHRRHCEEG